MVRSLSLPSESPDAQDLTAQFILLVQIHKERQRLALGVDPCHMVDRRRGVLVVDVGHVAAG